MVSPEILMRYIRIFSELSNRIRYESQKRVLVEIALIKLCRPAMETNLDSVLDRIRVLEKQMEEGAFVKQPPPAPSQEAAPRKEPKERPEAIPKAAPEDLQRVMESWGSIIAETSGRFKQMLLRSVPKFDGSAGEGEPVLYVEFQDYLAKPYVDGPEGKEELQALISDKTGKSVQVEMLLADNHTREGLAELSVDEIIKKEIHMNVETEN